MLTDTSLQLHARARWGEHLSGVQLAFLVLFAAAGNVSAACRELGIARSEVYDWRTEQPAFAVAWVDAEEAATEALEREAWHRAEHGVTKPMVSKGEIVTYVQEYSDTLMALLLAGRRPEKYSKQRLEHSGTLRVGLEEDLTQLSQEELVQWRALAVKAQRTQKALGTGT